MDKVDEVDEVEKPVNVRVLYFAQAQERCGLDEEHCELPPSTSVEEIFALLGARHPTLGELLPRCRLAVDQAFVSGELTLHADSELAVIPPVSGG